MHFLVSIQCNLNKTLTSIVCTPTLYSCKFSTLMVGYCSCSELAEDGLEIIEWEYITEGRKQQ